jgi:hypothetical protein
MIGARRQFGTYEFGTYEFGTYEFFFQGVAAVRTFTSCRRVDLPGSGSRGHAPVAGHG